MLKKLHDLQPPLVPTSDVRALLSFADSSSCTKHSFLLILPQQSCPCCSQYLPSYFQSIQGFTTSKRFLLNKFDCYDAILHQGTEDAHLLCKKCTKAFHCKNCQYFISISRNYFLHSQWLSIFHDSLTLVFLKSWEKQWGLAVFFDEGDECLWSV